MLMRHKIVPIVAKSDEIQWNDLVEIVNDDDDMNGEKGRFQEKCLDNDGIFRYLILLETNRKLFWALPYTLRKLEP